MSETDLIPDATPDTSTLVGGIMRTARPRQWVKNVLVLAAPLAAGIASLESLAAVAVAFAAFCLSASGIYFLNDALDVEADRAHPRKRHRPIAAGVVPVGLAYAIAAVLLIAGIALGLVATWQLAATVAVYAVVQIAYCVWLKHQPIVDIAIVSSGFLLRAIAGAAAVSVPLSQWFLTVAVFGSLLMVAGKRYAEILVTPDTELHLRRSLRHYTPSYLRFVWQLSAGTLILSYSLWAFDPNGAGNRFWLSVSVAPFILAVLRYSQHIDRGDAEAPEDIALGDRGLQVIAVIWLALLAVGLYLVPASG